MLSKILIGIVVILVGLAIVVAVQPSDYQIKRSATIAAPPEAVFEQVNDFQKWQAWSPWEKMDPEMKRTYEGPAAGEGAKYAWVGNSDVGEGSMTITESRPSELVRMRLDFVKPMESTADTEFKFKPDGDHTDVSWTMSGKNGFMGKAFSLFMNMDKMLGGQFEEGLANLKSTVEQAPDNGKAESDSLQPGTKG